MTERKLVIPGDLLGEGVAGSGTYAEGGKIFSQVVGLADMKDRLHFVIPLNGIYDPRRGDGIIGKIQDIAFSHWVVNINSPYTGVLPLNEAVTEFVDLTKADLTKYFNYGDVIFAKISNVTKTKNIQLTMRDRKCRKLYGGRLVKVTAAKVPRIIGKSGSMVELIKEHTGCQIVVGQNGIVWLKGEKEDLAIKAIQEIEEKSHISGLTDRIKTFLEKESGFKTAKISDYQKPEAKPGAGQDEGYVEYEATEDDDTYDTGAKDVKKEKGDDNEYREI